jgi:tetratricopeptide (TPR) repeat protein
MISADKYKEINETETAVEYYLKGITLLEQAALPADLVTPYCNIANTFGEIGEPKQQNEYAYKALAAAKKTGLGQKIFMACFTLANAYVHTQQNNLVMAKKYIDTAGIYFDEKGLINSPDIQVTYYLIRAQVFRQLEQFDSAEFYFKKCYSVAETYNYSYGKGRIAVAAWRGLHSAEKICRCRKVPARGNPAGRQHWVFQYAR